MLPGQPPESVTPESPGTRPALEVASTHSLEPPSSGGRSVASGTLLSVGAVDPRGKTERTLETPRMFISQAEAAEAYFKPGKIPAVTVHQTMETETVKLSDSVDPRRAKTIPPFERSAVTRLAELDSSPESAAPMAVSQPASGFDLDAAVASSQWTQDRYEPQASSLPSRLDGQIHASISAFRSDAEPSFSLSGAPTRAEPLGGRRASDVPPPVELPSAPEAGAIPTQRDLPAHRLESLSPPRPPVSSVGRAKLDSAVPASEGPSPTTASIAVEEPERRPAWLNYAAFLGALGLALLLGWLVTRTPEKREALPDTLRGAPTAITRPPAPLAPVPVPPAAPLEVAPLAAEPTLAPTPPEPAAPRVVRKDSASPASRPAPAVAPPATPAAEAPRKSAPPKTTRETIF